jgi:hypothetical protein
MTEAEWLAWDNPEAMEESLHSRCMRDESVFRLIRLYGVACCRRVWHLLRDPRSRAAVEVAERMFDVNVTYHEQVRVWKEAWQVVDELYPGREFGYPYVLEELPTILLDPHWDEADQRYGYVWITDEHNPRADEAECLALARCIFRNKFRPTKLDPSWRTDATVSMAKRMYDSRDFGVMPILADALEDAGCTNADILSHCRGPGPHVRGCWVVDLLLGKG